MHQKQLLFIYFLFSSITLSFAQLSTKHYIPPVAVSNSTAIQEQYLYISTPKNNSLRRKYSRKYSTLNVAFL